MNYKPRPYQSATLDKIGVKYWAGVRRMLVKYATGLGKTPLFALLRSHMKFQKRGMFIAHTEELIDQAAKKVALWNPGVTVGIEKAEKRQNGETLVVSSVQTIGRLGSPRLLQFNPFDFDFLVIDEGHHAMAQSYRTVIDHFTQNPDLLLLLVTATPNRADGKGLGEIVQEIVDDKDIMFGVREGWLAEPRGRVFRTRAKLDNVRTRAGDFALDDLSKEVNTEGRNDQVVRSWLMHGEDRQSVFFTVDIQHAKDLARAFQGYGIAAEAIWGDDPHRAEKLAYHKQGKLKILCNAQLLTEGYDDWRVSLIGVARPTQSEGAYQQMIGRGTRIPDGIDNLKAAIRRGEKPAKVDCLVFDYVDATSRHSLVTLASLHGMDPETDMKGQGLLKVLDKVEEVKQEHPGIDLSHVKDIDQLETYAEEVDLFKVSFDPEVVQFSEYAWRKMGEGHYIILLMGGETVSLQRDMLDRWHIIGTVNKYEIRDYKDSFEEAIREADMKLQIFGGKQLVSAAKQKMKKDSDPPTPAQMILLRRLGVKIPPGATFGDVRHKINQVLAKRKARKAAA